jgi:hypothetical protein
MALTIAYFGQKISGSEIEEGKGFVQILLYKPFSFLIVFQCPPGYTVCFL